MAAKTMRFQILWARQRIGEMDAALAALRRQAKSFPAPETAQLVADLKKRRNRFAAMMKDQTREGEIAWRRAKARLMQEWKGFEKDLNRYLGKASLQLGLRQSAFQRLSGAQAKAWRGTAVTLQRWKNSLVPGRRRGLAAVLAQVQTEARQAQARAKKLGRAGATSWSAMRSALAHSRRAFDRAHREAHRAIRKAVK